VVTALGLVVVVVVGAVVLEVLVDVVVCDAPLVEAPWVVVVVVVVCDAPLVVDVVPDVDEPLAPGCSLATTTPISAIAPAAPSTANRVTCRRRIIARSRAPGVFVSVERFMEGGLVCRRLPPISPSTLPG